MESINNLLSLYESIATFNSDVELIENELCISVISKNSVWPNVNYYNGNLTGEILETIGRAVVEKKVPPLVLTLNDFELSLAKELGFYPIDSWSLMKKKIDTEINEGIFNSNDSFKFQKVMDVFGFKIWCEVVSKNLFSGKKLDSTIIQSLDNNSADFFCIKYNGKVAATTMAYYDENNIAGIYMVCVEKELRGKGLGKLIMDYTLNKILERGISTVILQSTKMGELLYKNLGFEQTGLCKLFYKIK